MSDFTFHVDEIAEDCYDLYLSDDDGYTWEYYGSFEDRNTAYETGEAAVWNAEAEAVLGIKDYISYDN